MMNWRCTTLAIVLIFCATALAQIRQHNSLNSPDGNARYFDLEYENAVEIVGLISPYPGLIILDAGNFAALDSNATDAYDSLLDVPEPNPVPQEYLSLYFPHPEWGCFFGDQFMVDARSADDLTDTVKIYDFEVSTDLWNQRVSLVLRIGDQVPVGYGAFFYDPTTLIIQDIGVDSTYDFIYPASADPYHCQLILGNGLNLPSGPDAYGYQAWDNLDAGEAQSYNWIEIAPIAGGLGQPLGLVNDDQTVTISLPFQFKYYDQIYTEISVCTNGWVALGSTSSVDRTNSTIPGPDGPPAMIAALWDDLHPGLGGSEICSYHDSSQHRFIIEWYRIAHSLQTDLRETFQVILYDPFYYPTASRDGRIVVQHNRVADVSSATIGIENAAQNDGIEYSFNGSYDEHAWYIVPGRAITYTNNTGSASQISITLTPYGTPIQIPATGGSFTYNLAGENSGDLPVYRQVWCDLALPNGGTYGPVMGPVILYMFPGWNRNVDRTQNLPAHAPAGIYTFNAYAGLYPDLVDAQDSFTFEKLGVAGNGWVSDWENAGEYWECPEMPVSEAINQQETPIGCSIFPNPFNSTTAIRFSLPDPQPVSVSVYEIGGREIATLTEGVLEVGSHELKIDASCWASGIYVVRLSTSETIIQQKIIHVK
ncbi:MAG: T9SS type A sorting domain-containing protein [bacterium]